MTYVVNTGLISSILAAGVVTTIIYNFPTVFETLEFKENEYFSSTRAGKAKA